MNNHEYNNYVESAYQIFQKCFETENIKEERGWTNELSEALEGEFPGNHVTKKSLGDLYGRINRLRSENETFLEMGVSEKTLELLSGFALIDDYKALNRSYRGIPVFYAPRPFSLFNILRIPVEGWLYKSAGEWIFKSGAAVIFGNKTIADVEYFRMPGDAEPAWVKIGWQTEDEKIHEAYFSHAAPETGDITFINPAKLYNFFNKGI